MLPTQRKRVTGVNYVARGQSRRVTASRETVLAAGPFGSPHLLQLSGSGDAERFSGAGVAVRHHLPGVGENLQDHLHFRSRWEITRPLTFCGRTMAERGQAERLYGAERAGPLTTNHFESGAFLPSDPSVGAPDIELLMIPFFISLDAPELRPPDRHGFTISGFPTRPRSRGRVTIVSDDPLDRPAVDPGYLSDADDLRTMLALIRETRRIVAQEAFDDIRGDEISPGSARHTEEELIAEIRGRASTEG